MAVPDGGLVAVLILDRGAESLGAERMNATLPTM
jgi:hypothetical protein